MNHLKVLLLLPMILFSIISCESSVNSTSEIPGDWLVPQEEVFDGGPGKDGIPALSEPSFVNNSSIEYMGENDLIIGVKFDGEIRGYPHSILDWHEIINDKINDNYFSVTYCPLTGSTINYNRDIDGDVTTFGVSGLLYNTNLIPYDRSTNSNWSQMKLLCINGKLKGKIPVNYLAIETSWATWVKTFPTAKVVSTNTGYNRNYGHYPYGSYRTNNSLIFPVSSTNDQLPMKERVHGIIHENRTFAYRFNSFENGISMLIKKIDFNDIIVVGSKTDNFIVSYYKKLSDGTNLAFKVVHDKLPIILTDNEGNSWDIFGEAVGGARLGQRLKPTKSFIAY